MICHCFIAAISQEDDDSALETSSSDNTEQPDSNTAAPGST